MKNPYVARSERYGDPRASLLDAPSWNAARSDVCRSLSLPEAPGPFLDRLGAEPPTGAPSKAYELSTDPSLRAFAR